MGSGRPRPAQPPGSVCHGDFGPWNVVWNGPAPVGILDGLTSTAGLVDAVIAVQRDTIEQVRRLAASRHLFE